MANNWQIDLLAGLDSSKSKSQINQDIDKIKNGLKELELKAKLDPNQVKSLESQLNNLKVSINNATISQSALNGMVTQINNALKGIQIGNVNIGGTANIGQQIGNNIAQGVSSGVVKATTTVKSFSTLIDSMKSQKVELNTEGLIDDKKTLDAIKQTYSEFGQVKITNKVFDSGELQSFKVNIEQVNGELKETRTFMMELNGAKTKFVFPDDVVKGTEKYVQHLNAAKNATNATGEALNAQNQRLAEQAKYYDRLKEETNNLYNLKQKLLSADTLQTAELEKQIKSTKQRITYNNQQIDKKGLRDDSLTREINDLEVARQKQLALSTAKAQDVANTKAQAQAQKEANAVLKEQQTLQSQVNKIQLSMSSGGDTTTQIDILRNSFTKLGLSADEVKNKMNGVDTEVKELKNLMSNGASDSAITTQFERLQTVLSQTQNDLKSTRSEYSLLATEQQRLSLANTIEAWNQKNTAATKAVREENERYVISLRDLSNQMTRMDFNKINTGFKQNENSMRALNKLGASLKNQLIQAGRSFTTWLSASTMVMKTISETREAITNIKELDNILTEISKTSDMTAESLEKLGMKSYDTASKYGRTSKDYLSAFESMARSGFYGKQGESMAEQSLLAQAAGDMSQEIADKYILATNAAYKFDGEASKLNAVLDGMNTINKMVALYGNI